MQQPTTDQAPLQQWLNLWPVMRAELEERLDLLSITSPKTAEHLAWVIGELDLYSMPDLCRLAGLNLLRREG